MRSNGDVTLFHFDEASESFKVAYFPNVHISYKQVVSKSGIKQKGFYAADRGIVRIPTVEKIEVAVGDYVHLGRCNSEMPDRANDLKITQVSDNRVGSLPHFKISCGG